MTTVVLAARDGRIEQDTPCLHCGYNLRTLAAAASCPECGMAVRTSLRGDRLGEAPPAYLRKVLRGAAVFRTGVLCALPLVYPGLPFAAIGLWWVTAPQPGRDEPATDVRRRWACRGLLLSGLAGMLLVIAAVGATGFVWRRDFLGNSWGHLDAVFVFSHALFVLGLFQAWGYLAALGMRIPDDAMVTECRRLRRRWQIAVALIVGLTLLVNLMEWFDRPRWAYAYYLVTGLMVAAFYFFVFLWLWAATLNSAIRITRGLRRVTPADG